MAAEAKSDDKAMSESAAAPLAGKLKLPLALLTLAAFMSPISQATLAPVYGAIPSSIGQTEAVVSAAILGFLWRALFQYIPSGYVAQCIGLWAFFVPVIQFYLFSLSEDLGPVRGPALIRFLTCHTVITASTYAAAEALEKLDLEARFGSTLTGLITSVVGVVYVTALERWFKMMLLQLFLLSQTFTPVKLELLIAATYSYVAPSKLRLLAIPALIHAFYANPHFDSTLAFGKLDQALHAYNFTILERQWSNTGYISVIEDLSMQYRLLRCDHSLLGGEWRLTDERRDKEGWTVNEPVYAVFEMLEAVRLVEVDTVVPDNRARALVVGLGIGSAPKALIEHGINTTVVELDPIIHNFATKYFGLPTNHVVVLEDAVHWVGKQVVGMGVKYDYIIHDVFTGGAEPLGLFTDQFLYNLRSLLKADGVIALNYAGDPAAPLTSKVLNTIRSVFESQCKIYRDTPPKSNETGDKASINGDFSNMVIFCRNSPGPVRFRKPIKVDFLGSKSREHYLLPNSDYEIQFPDERPTDSGYEALKRPLKPGEEWLWSGKQVESAISHWRIMRKVVPPAVWELW